MLAESVIGMNVVKLRTPLMGWSTDSGPPRTVMSWPFEAAVPLPPPVMAPFSSKVEVSPVLPRSMPLADDKVIGSERRFVPPMLRIIGG